MSSPHAGTLSDKLQSIALLALVGCALVLTAFRVRDYLSTPPDPLEPQELTNAASFFTGRNRLGRADAPVKIVEFADFQCPYCRKAATDLKELAALFGDSVSVEYRHFPLDGHQYARSSAHAAECAADQQRFQEYHDLLYAKADSIGIIDFVAFARRVQVSDTAGFRSCMLDSSVAGRVAQDEAAGRRVPVDGTPTLIVNGKVIRGYPGRERLTALVREELRK